MGNDGERLCSQENVNAHSLRSHTVLQVHAEQSVKAQAAPMSPKMTWYCGSGCAPNST